MLKKTFFFVLTNWMKFCDYYSQGREIIKLIKASTASLERLISKPRIPKMQTWAHFIMKSQRARKTIHLN